MKNILTLLFFAVSTTCFAQWATNDYASKILLFDSKDNSGTRIQIIDYKTDSTLQELTTNSDGGISGWVDKLVKNKKYKIIASKTNFRDLIIDSVSILGPSGDITTITWPYQFTQLLPLPFIPISDTLNFDLKRDQTYVVTKDVIVSSNISISNRTRLCFFGKLLLAKGVKVSARGSKGDSVYFEASKFKLAEGVMIDFSYCKFSNSSIETNSNINLDTNTKINISHSLINNSNFINGKKINVHLDNNSFINSQLFSADSLIKVRAENNIFINSGLGVIYDSKIENEIDYDDTDTLKYKIIFCKNIFKSDLSSTHAFIQNMNSSVLFTNNKIESYKFVPMSIKTDNNSDLLFTNNQIMGSFDVSANKITNRDTYNRIFFVDNNITLNGYSSMKNNSIQFINNLLNLNTYQLTIHGVHDGCPCVETTLKLTSNTVLNGRLWFNTTTNNAQEAYMIMSGNIVNAEIVTSNFIATGNVLKKDLFVDYFKKPTNITDDETMEGWVYHHDKREIFDGSNLYVDSDMLLNNSAPFYHGSCPFLYDTTYETIDYRQNIYLTYSGIKGYNPIGTSIASIFPEYQLPNCDDTCSISGDVYSNSGFFNSIKVDLLITNQETSERRITSCYPGKFKFSFLPKGNYIAQVIPNGNPYNFTSFYVNTTEPKKASSISVEGHVEGIYLHSAPRIVLLNTAPYNTNGLTFNISYHDISESDDELVYRGFKDESVFHNAAKFLPIYLQNVDGSVVYFGSTDTKGSLNFPRIPYGTYKVVAQRYGYKLLNDDLLVINSSNSVVIENILVKDNDPTGIEETKSFEAIVPKVMPNPFKDVLTIQSVDLNASIQIFDATGKVIYDQKIDNLISTINTANWPNGVYIVRTGETTVKVVK
jgi:hypothetical protein